MNQYGLDFNSHLFYDEEKNDKYNINYSGGIFGRFHSIDKNKNNQRNLFSYDKESYELNNQKHYNIKGRTNDVLEQNSPNKVNNDFQNRQFSYDNKNNNRNYNNNNQNQNNINNKNFFD